MANRQPDAPAPNHPLEIRESVTIRLAGDSGDGMQLVGSQFTHTSALLGNDISTLPDFPAEIRAPAGTLSGVSGFQIHFSSTDIHTPGDELDALVAMNPAALKTNLRDLQKGGILIVNRDAFVSSDLAKANYTSNPLEDGSLSGYRVFAVPITTLNREAVADLKLSTREADRCKNFFALGLVYWLYERSLEPTQRWLQNKFSKNPAILEANLRSLRAGYHYGETTEAMVSHFSVPKAKLPPGLYRKLTGNEAIALGLVAAAERAGLPLVFAGYPITPASDILQALSELSRFGVKTLQAEDEIAAMGAAIGAAFGGALGATATSGPGICLKSEGMGLAVMTELPVVIIDVQRGGPSTGLPTKTEQADLLQVMFGRNGESPLAVMAPATPADCFTCVYEAVRLAIRHMTPVVLLSDGYLANGAEPWLVPQVEQLPPIPVHFATTHNGEEDGRPVFLPYQRDEMLARPWAVPGTPGLEHRVGGLEKQDITGNISYDPINHEHMVHLRAEKIARIAEDIAPLKVHGPESGDLLVVGWGGTYGSLLTAVQRLQRKGRAVALAHFRHLNPMPANTAEVLSRYKKVLVCELNNGQLQWLIRSRYLVDAQGLHKIQGKPFLVSEIEQAVEQQLAVTCNGVARV